MEKIRAEVNSRKAQQLEALGAEKDLDELADFESERYDSSGGDTDARFVVKQQYHINDFLQYHGAAFIKNAYRGILGREADLPAYIYYWGNLKAGKMSKIEILGRLRFSAEGRAKRAHVHGLWLRFVVHLSFRIPILGYFSRLVVGAANLPTLIKNIEVNDSYVRSHLAGLQAQLSQITKSMQTNISEIKEIVADLQMKNSTSAQLDLLASNKWKINELEQSAANKADRIELKKLAAVKADRSELESFASRKADISFIDHLNDSKADRSEVQDLFSHLTDGMRQLHDFRRSLVDQERRLRILLEEVRKNLGGHPPEILIPKLEAERDHLLDALYVSFEDRFRGTNAEIKERQRIYIDYLQRSKVGSIDS
ncbi:MAG: DUF4214 domain-containing protein, partial [Desulforhabdus sp.]|nr:DUF4214 domain-containing protein [Desulforhabdus sp.]